jgi:hypothetical protein
MVPNPFVTAETTLDPGVAHEVAAAYVDASVARRDPRVVAAYADLQAQSDSFFAYLTQPDRPWSVRVVFTRHPEPYASDGELIDAVRARRLLEVPVVPGRVHPVLGDEPGGPYDRFRAVHDILGHVHLGRGFDRDGEYATWRAQDLQYRGPARWALAAELHGEHSVRWTTGEPAEHKGVLLPRALVARARRGRGHVENLGAASTSG